MKVITPPSGPSVGSPRSTFPASSMPGSARKRGDRSRKVGWGARGAFATLLALAALSGTGCASCERAGMAGLSLMSGTINDPANKSLRRGMMSFALDRACKEMMMRTTALREGGETSGAATNPTNGRFFPRSCTQTTAPNGDLVISFSGVGYTYASVVHKVTFEASASIQYDQDFLMSGDDLYAYFRTKQLVQTNFQLKVIESTLPAMANQLTGFGDKYAKQLMNERLRDGFTVRRRPDSETDFRAGIVQLGTWPKVSYQVKGGLVLVNDRTEVHEQQRDFLGPFSIDEAEQILTVTGKIDGAPAMNVLVMEDSAVKPWIEKYLTVGEVTPPPSKPLQQAVVKQNEQFQLDVTGKGVYWIVFDNTGTIPGGAKPPGNLLDDRAAVANYSVVLREK